MKRDQQPTRVERSGLKAGAAAIASDASLRAAGVKKRICTKKGTASIKGRVAPVGDSSKQARLAAARLFKEHDTAGSGFLQPHSTQLWALCAAVVTECFPWLGTEEQRKVQLALPKLVAAGVPSKGVSLQDFTQHFMELRKKLKLRQKASKLLASAKQQEEEGRLEAAGKSYRACLALAPRNADAHLGYALLLHSSVADKLSSSGQVEEHLRAAVEFSTSAEQKEEAAGKLAFVLCQDGETEAKELLLRLGFRYRLADCVLRHNREDDACHGGNIPDDGQRELMAVVDNALPKHLLSHLQSIFGPGAPFWSEHGYCSYPPSPYFSYMHELDDQPASSLDQVIQHVMRLVSSHFPAVAEAKCAEWWAHNRPHTHGHQLHFDSDNEGEDGVRNPIASTILYLSEGVGGPTLMTTQHVKDTRLATRGWLAFPKLNRLVAFDGEYLHGVIPGRSAEQPRGERRISLMVAFWRHSLKQRPRGDGRPGACMPRPVVRGGPRDCSSGTWQDALQMLPKIGKAPKTVRVGAQAVDAVWQDVCPQQAEEDLCSIAKLNSLPGYNLCFQGF